MTSSSVLIPPVATTRRWAGWWLIPIVVAAAVGIAAISFHPWSNGSGGPVVGQFYTVVPTDLDIKIAKDGELQAVNYTDVKCQVEGFNAVIELVKEGASVQKGDKLVVIDSTSIQERKDDVDQQLTKAQSALKIALEMKEIQESQNNTNRDAFEVSVELAKIDLQQYQEGTYPQQVENAKTALQMAGINLKNKEDDQDQTQSLFGKGFVTAVDVKKAELDVTNARNDLRKAQTALLVLEKYSHAMDTARLLSAKAQAEQRLARIIKENASLLNQRSADVEEKQASLRDLQERQTKLQKQLDNCIIRAPEDGLVIYATSVDRGIRDLIQEGMQVRQNQWLLRLPDVRSMKAVLKIQEAQKPKLDVDKKQRATVHILGIPKPVGATLSKVAVLPDNSQRWWNPDLKEYPIELTLDETPAGLKPGVRVDCEIYLQRIEHVMAVPLQCIYAEGDDSYVFVKQSDRAEPRKVTMGESNETMMQISSGLKDGDQVLQLQAGQGRTLLEKAGIKISEGSAKAADEPGRKKGRKSPDQPPPPAL